MNDLAEGVAGAARPFVPSALDGRSVPTANRVLRRRAPLILSAGEGRVALRLVAPPPIAADAVWLAGGLDGAVLAVAAPAGLLRARAGPEVQAFVGAELGALVLEALVAPWLDAFERATGHGVEFQRVGGAPPEGVDLGLDVQFADGGRTCLPLRAGPAALAALAAATDGLAERPVAAGALPVTLHLRLAAARLTLGELQSLGPGDVVVAATPPDETWLVVGERLAARLVVEPGGAGARLAGPLRAMEPRQRESWTMNEAADDGGGNEAQALDELPVRLAFELGRLEVSLGELRRMGEGHVLTVDRDPAAPVDVLANGRRIGQGELVRLDAGLGVRILRLFGQA